MKNAIAAILTITMLAVAGNATSAQGENYRGTPADITIMCRLYFVEGEQPQVVDCKITRLVPVKEGER